MPNDNEVDARQEDREEETGLEVWGRPCTADRTCASSPPPPFLLWLFAYCTRFQRPLIKVYVNIQGTLYVYIYIGGLQNKLEGVKCDDSTGLFPGWMSLCESNHGNKPLAAILNDF